MHICLAQERYADAIRGSPEAIGRILALLERLKTPESLRLTMALISRLCTPFRWPHGPMRSFETVSEA